MPSFSFILLMVSEEKNFEYFFENLPFMLPHQPIKLSDLDKSRMIHFFGKNSNNSSETAETVNFHFSHYKSMGNYKLP